MTKRAISAEALAKSLLGLEGALKQDLANNIRSLNKEHKGDRTFIVMSSDLEYPTILLPSYYNLRVQYEEIAQRILKTPLSGIDGLIKKICTSSVYNKKVKEAVLKVWKGSLCPHVQKKKQTSQIC